jgi:hypothetical protein
LSSLLAVSLLAASSFFASDLSPLLFSLSSLDASFLGALSLASSTRNGLLTSRRSATASKFAALV